MKNGLMAMAIADDALVEQLIYDSPQGRRLLQDSPVMPDIWMAFAQAPTQPLELLITPLREVRAADAGNRLRRAVARTRDGLASRVAEFYGQADLRLSPLSNQVAVRLSFPELIGAAIPLSAWGQSLIAGARRGAFGDGREAFLARLAPALVDEEVSRGLPAGLVWLVRLAGLIHLSTDRDHGRDIADTAALLLNPQAYRDAGRGDAVTGAAVLVSRAFLELAQDGYLSDTDEAPSERPAASRKPCVHRVVRNRPVELAVNQSTAAIKADAARRLFKICCSSITWAVIDSGIDTEHAAFRDHESGGCRVDAVYDFTVLRQLNDLDVVETALADGPGNRLFDELRRRQTDPSDGQEVIRILALHRDRLEAGDDIDYSLIEPFLRDCHPRRPAVRHGTHVAGILGADWRDNGTARMTGVCPDIHLIDMRIIRADGGSDEFEVISALEFLRHYNDRSGRLGIHGVNLSISIDHNLRGGDACGRTPVCMQCEQTVRTGVCVVVAAGNRGNINLEYNVRNRRQRIDVYLDASITDPGNAESVITVGATHRNRPHEYGVSFFSSRGPTGDGRIKPDIVAPGEKITGPAPGQDMYEADGTSMAAPHVSGAAALIMARHAELIGRPDRIKEILCATATDLKREAYFQGAGLVDVLRALQSV